MYEFSSDVYVEVAQRLLEAIGDNGYFNGVVTYHDDDVCCRLHVMVVVRTLRTPSRLRVPVTDVALVPVWWEMSTVRCDEEVENDFSFNEMMDALWTV